MAKAEKIPENLEEVPNPLSDIEVIQTALNEHGFECSVDGVYGPVTTNAVKRFQSSKRIKVDGIVAEKTRPFLLGE